MATFPSSLRPRPLADYARCRALVKDGGSSALPDAKRRGDAATYQEIRCRSALNRCKGMPFMKWTLNPYRGCTHGCHYCFARKYQTQLELNAGDRLRVGDLREDQLRGGASARARQAAWTKENIGFGTATDPYQPIEGTYKLRAACSKRCATPRRRSASSPRGR